MYTREQQAANRAKWLAALRSGAYTQTTGMLHKEDGGYCCLGVACDLYSQVDPSWEWEPTDSTDGAMHFKSKNKAEYSVGTLPVEVADWLGLSLTEGQYSVEYGLQRSLVLDNDDAFATFEDIADIIEREPRGLLK